MKKITCSLIFILFLFSGCKYKSASIANTHESKSIDEIDGTVTFVGKDDASTKEQPVENKEKILEVFSENTEYDDFFIVEEYDDYFKDHSFLADYTLPGRVIDSICLLAMEYYEKNGKMPDGLDSLYAEELKNSKAYLNYAISVKKENDKKAVISIVYGINEDKTYVVIYERKDEHVFYVYNGDELEYIIHRDENSVHTEYVD